jgi:hypothetical protein
LQYQITKFSMGRAGILNSGRQAYSTTAPGQECSPRQRPGQVDGATSPIPRIPLDPDERKSRKRPPHHARPQPAAHQPPRRSSVAVTGASSGW